jgi:hypothetical protein
MINPTNRKWWKNFQLPSIEGLIPQYRGDVDETARAGRLRSGFAGYAKRLGPVITERFGDREASLVLAEARVEFESLIRTIPFIGGRANPLTWNLETSAMFLALYRALERRGVGTPEAGTLFARMIDRWLSSFPRILLRVGGLWRFSPWYLRSIRRRAKWSGRRTYPDDFVYDFVPAGPGFDWGVNYTECAIVKFYGAHGAGELVPFMCPIDFQLSRAFGLGLRRSQTIALGDPRCDFRFRRGGPTVDLSTRQPQRMPAASA